MTCAVIGKGIGQCMRTPIEWKQEKTTLLIITGLVVLLLAAGFLGHYYTAGSSLDWFGTAQGGAYACWALGGVLALGTAASYIARSILSKNDPYTPSPDVSKK